MRLQRPATARARRPARTRSPARPAAAPARSRTCSARSSARSAPCARARPAAASARSSRTRAASAPATAGSGRAARSPSRSRPASTTAPGSSSPSRARSARAAARPATCTSRSTSRRTTTFTRHGNDLHCTVTLPMTAAALGTTLTLPTLEADVSSEGADDRRRDDLRARRPARHPVRHRAGAARARRPRAARRPRRPRRHVVVETPTRLDAAPGGAAPRARRASAARSSRPARSAPARSRSSAGCATRSTPSTDVAAGPPGARRWPAWPPGPSVEVTGDEAHHAVAVRRLRVGESVVLTDGAGTSVTGEVAVDRQAGLRGDRDLGPGRARARARRWSSCRRCPRATAASSRSRC